MTNPTQSVKVRRTAYGNLSQPLTPVLYDNLNDFKPNENVLDEVLEYQPLYNIRGYQWNGARQALSSSPTYSSGEVGAVNTTTLAITFSRPIIASNYLSGVTIKINGSTQVITVATRQANHAIVYYTIPAADANDVVTWAYSKASGNIVDEQNNGTLEDTAAQTATNNVAGVAPQFVSAEIGSLSSGTVVVTFNMNVFSPYYATGTVITINSGSVLVTSAARQVGNGAKVNYVLATPASNGKVVKFNYTSGVGIIINEADDTPLASLYSGTVTNNT